MASRHPKQTIAPFLGDRNAFGWWLSGFTDGEGCFGVRVSTTSYYSANCTYRIRLRSDDQAILYRIQSFFGCGKIYHDIRHKERTWKSKNANPCSDFTIHHIRQCHDIIVPHFNAFPLQAKKARDFSLWCKAVDLMYRVSLRGVPSASRPGHQGGSHHRWSEDERSQFNAITLALREQRKFNAPTIEPPKIRCRPDQPTFFD